MSESEVNRQPFEPSEGPNQGPNEGLRSDSASEVRDERRPWSPIPLVLLVLIGALPAGGTLLGLNWMRLGYPERGRKTLLVFALIVVGTALLGAWLNARGVVGAPTSRGMEGSGGGYFNAWFFIHIAAAMVVAFQQRKHFEAFLESGGRPGNPLFAIALALVGGILVQQAVVRMAVRLFS